MKTLLQNLQYGATILLCITLIAFSVQAQEDNGFLKTGLWPDGPCNAVAAVDDEWLLMGNGASLEVLKLVQGAQPESIARVIVGSTIRDIKVLEDYAYVAIDEHGFVIIDIEQRITPAIVGQFDVSGHNGAVYPEDDLVFLTSNSHYLYVVDVTEPSHPVKISQTDLGVNPRGIGRYGEFLFVAAGHDGVGVVDVSDVHEPELVSVVTTPYAYDIGIAGNYAYVPTGDTIVILDISDPLNTVISNYYETTGYKSSVLCRDGRVYISDTYDYLLILDAEDPVNLVEISDSRFPGLIEGLDVHGDQVFLAHTSEGVTTIDVSDPVEPQKAWNHFTAGLTMRSQMVGDMLFLANGRRGVAVLDMALEEPRSVVQLKTEDLATGIAVVDNIAYIADRSGLFTIADVSCCPDTITEVVSIDIQGSTWDVLVEGKYAYLAQRYDGLRILDISNPEAPFEVGVFETETVWSLDKVNNLVFLAQDDNGLAIVDVSDPSEPELVGLFDEDIRDTWSVAVRGSYAYLADSYDGLKIINVWNPAEPVEESRLWLRGNAKHVVLYGDGDTVIVAADWGGVYAIDVSDPKNPVEVCSHNTGGSALDIEIADKQIIVSDYECGVTVLEFNPSVGFEVISPEEYSALCHVFPNPTSGQTMFEYTLDRPADVSIVVSDIEGRTIEQLVNARQEIGDYKVLWNAASNTGIPAGLYVYRVRIGNRECSGRIVVQ